MFQLLFKRTNYFFFQKENKLQLVSNVDTCSFGPCCCFLYIHLTYLLLLMNYIVNKSSKWLSTCKFCNSLVNKIHRYTWTSLFPSPTSTEVAAWNLAYLRAKTSQSGFTLIPKGPTYSKCFRKSSITDMYTWTLNLLKSFKNSSMTDMTLGPST